MLQYNIASLLSDHRKIGGGRCEMEYDELTNLVAKRKGGMYIQAYIKGMGTRNGERDKLL